MQHSKKLLRLLLNFVLLSCVEIRSKSYKDVFGIKFRLKLRGNFANIISLIPEVNTMKK